MIDDCHHHFLCQQRVDSLLLKSSLCFSLPVFSRSRLERKTGQLLERLGVLGCDVKQDQHRRVRDANGVSFSVWTEHYSHPINCVGQFAKINQDSFHKPYCLSDSRARKHIKRVSFFNERMKKSAGEFVWFHQPFF